MKIEDSWSDSMEKAVRKIRNHCSRMSELHKDAGNCITNCHMYVLSIVIITIIIFSITLIQNKVEPFFMIIVFSYIIIYFLAYKFMGLGEYNLHYKYSYKYRDLIVDIDHQLSFKKEFRKDANEFICGITSTLYNLNKNSPNFPVFFSHCP